MGFRKSIGLAKTYILFSRKSRKMLAPLYCSYNYNYLIDYLRKFIFQDGLFPTDLTRINQIIESHSSTTRMNSQPTFYTIELNKLFHTPEYNLSSARCPNGRSTYIQIKKDDTIIEYNLDGLIRSIKAYRSELIKNKAEKEHEKLKLKRLKEDQEYLEKQEKKRLIMEKEYNDQIQKNLKAKEAYNIQFEKDRVRKLQDEKLKKIQRIQRMEKEEQERLRKIEKDKIEKAALDKEWEVYKKAKGWV